jgi:ATP-dependent Clp protease adaptor protein ClpS
MSSSSISDTPVLEKTTEAIKPARPPRVKVVLINDDYTPFEFVIDVIQTVFSKTEVQAIALAVQIHEEGKGVCGVYVQDIAELKQMKVRAMAKKDQHPLQCVLEPEAPSSSPSGGPRP